MWCILDFYFNAYFIHSKNKHEEIENKIYKNLKDTLKTPFTFWLILYHGSWLEWIHPIEKL